MSAIQVQQNILLAALQSVSGVVERKHTLPILSNILLRRQEDTLEITGSDLEIQMRTKVSLSSVPDNNIGKSFEVTIDCRKLMDALRSINEGQQIQFKTQENRVTLREGKSRFVLQALPAEDFPLVQEASDPVSELSIPQKKLKALIEQVSFAMAYRDLRYYLNGLLFVINEEKIILVATDGNQMAYTQAELSIDIHPCEVILPRKTALELQRLLSNSDDEVQIKIYENQVKFKFNKVELISKLIDGQFPNYNGVILKDKSKKLLVNRQRLLFALQSVSIITDEKFKGIHLFFEENRLRLVSNNLEQEEVNDEVETDYSGDPIKMGFNVKYLLDVLSNMTQDMVSIALTDGDNSILMTIPENNDFKYVVMPMRI